MHNRGFFYSGTFHALLLLLVIFGLPSFLEPAPLPQPMVMSVEILPVSEISNVQNAMPKPPKKTEEPKPLPPKQTVKEVKKEEPKKEEQKKEEKKPEPKPEPEKEIVPEKVKKEELKKEEKKPEPKKEEPKKEQPKKEEQKKDEKKADEPSLDDILKDLKDTTKTPPAPKTEKETGAPKEGPKAVSDAPFDQNSPAALALQDSIRSQIMPCWLYSSGAPEDKIKPAKILVSINKDGSVISAKLHSSQMGEYHTNGYFKAIVDSAIRATRNQTCTPLKNLPPEQYNMWKELVVTFDPRLMM